MSNQRWPKGRAAYLRATTWQERFGFVIIDIVRNHHLRGDELAAAIRASQARRCAAFAAKKYV